MAVIIAPFTDGCTGTRSVISPGDDNAAGMPRGGAAAPARHWPGGRSDGGGRRCALPTIGQTVWRPGYHRALATA